MSPNGAKQAVIVKSHVGPKFQASRRTLRQFLRPRELLSILVAFLILLAIGIFSGIDWHEYHEGRRQTLAARGIFEHSSVLLMAVTNAESGQRGFVLTGDGSYLEPYYQALGQIRNELEVLDKATADDSAIQEQVRRIRIVIGDKFAEMAETIQLRKQGETQKSVDLVLTGSGKRLMDSIRGLAAAILTEENRAYAARSLRVKNRSDRAHAIAIASSIVLLIILGLGAWTIGTATSRREDLIADLNDFAVTLDKAPVIISDPDGTIRYWNSGAEAMYGWSREEALGKMFHGLLRAEFSQPYEEIEADLLKNGTWTGEIRQRRRDNSTLWVASHWVLQVDSAGNAVSLIKINNDITELKRTSESLRISEEERGRLIVTLEQALANKIVLLKEVHHRVKNNMAVIAALLGMQSDAIPDQQARLSLRDSQQRVTSMALIHEFLYSDEQLDRVNLGAYAQKLASELAAACAVDPGLVTIRVDSEEIDVPVDQAIPCGLILNELLTNALKYAYPGGRRGEILVKVVQLESSGISVACADHGVGIPKDFNWERSASLGLRIVQILAKQLDGNLTVDRAGGGTRFELRFPRAKTNLKARSVRSIG